jgi:hypothetical protein
LRTTQGGVVEDDAMPDDAMVIIGVGDMAKRRALFEKFGIERVMGAVHDTAFCR